MVPVIVNSVLNEHQVVTDIVAFVPRGNFPRSRLGEKQRGKILASWITRKIRTMAQFNIRDRDAPGPKLNPPSDHIRPSKAASTMDGSINRQPSPFAESEEYATLQPLPPTRVERNPDEHVEHYPVSPEGTKDHMDHLYHMDPALSFRETDNTEQHQPFDIQEDRADSFQLHHQQQQQQQQQQQFQEEEQRPPPQEHFEPQPQQQQQHRSPYFDQNFLEPEEPVEQVRRLRVSNPCEDSSDEDTPPVRSLPPSSGPSSSFPARTHSLATKRPDNPEPSHQGYAPFNPNTTQYADVPHHPSAYGGQQSYPASPTHPPPSQRGRDLLPSQQRRLSNIPASAYNNPGTPATTQDRDYASDRMEDWPEEAIIYQARNL